MSRCKACVRVVNKERTGYKATYHQQRRTLDPDYNLRHTLKKRYGMTVEEYRARCAAQDNRCPLCLREIRLVVDHCHAKGHVRGLLCAHCNYMLGFLENKEWLARAEKYLGVRSEG